jgi:hypothetical protein
VSGEKVTFTAPASGASGTFANGTATEDAVTDDNGVATSTPFTANATSGNYTVTANVSGASAPVSFSLTNISVTAYSFYVSGMESETFSSYVLAGSVLIDSNGNVLGGEQDYNDGGLGFASPEPAGDVITGGTLTFAAGAPAGQGTLTLNTNNLNLGLNADGVEVFGVQFVNSKHALIMQFDGFDTSAGSFDQQTLPSTLSGAYAFAASGFDSVQTPVAFAGVFSITGGTALTGTLDVNDAFDVGITVGTAFTATLGPTDGLGRGKITGIKVAGKNLTLYYYIVNPKVIRFVDVDPFDLAIGSAFSQGTSPFSNASLGNSVMALSGTPILAHFAALGQFSTSNTSAATADFSGVGDITEPDNSVLVRSHKLTGTYSIASNGYGSWNITNIGLGDMSTLGVYMTDPALNLNDPNNAAGGGGALIIDLSPSSVLPGGAGIIIPQTDTSTASFAGNYVAGWQNFNLNCGDCEFDMLAQGSMAAGGALNLTGLASDPFFSLGTPDATSSGNTFTGTPAPDTTHPGRYTMGKKGQWVSSVIDGTPDLNFDMIVYQASGNQLFWLGYDLQFATAALGPLQQQGSLSGLPGAQARTATTRTVQRSMSRVGIARRLSKTR